MAIISFEKIAADDETVEVPDGYRGLNWENFIATDDEVFPNSGFFTAIHSGEASAFNYDPRNPAVFKSADSDADFDFNSGFFAAFNANDLKIKVFGFDDGEKVAAKIFFLDPEQEFVTFGRKFDDIDEVKITARGGTDADPNDGFGLHQTFAVDDLFIDF